GYLNDGTMIVVEDGEEFLGKMVEAVAHTTFRASGGTMVFSRIASQPEEDLRESVPEPAAAGTGDDEAD
ncbi:MAG TPA: hypothetical protein P5266_04755, partial [Candidatus Fermentibacter sp.]|nr:hypothetical protein [Candidatus Fermentibacter sp.]